jgi:hypothetical protein
MTGLRLAAVTLLMGLLAGCGVARTAVDVATTAVDVAATTATTAVRTVTTVVPAP